ncbi:hypothetical protein Tco_0512559 [Tanacetum coccineum]
MMRQKARIKWDVEGDENSKFFHSYMKRRNNKCNLRGIIKAEMARHFKSLFSENGVVHSTFCCNRIEKISEEEAISLEAMFSEKEVRDAVSGCEGGDKALRPDGFNFKFIKKVWDIIKEDLIREISWFWDRMEISRGCNASFGLNAIMNEAVANGIFSRVKVGGNNVMVSNLQYADDTIFFGVNEVELADMAIWMGCSVGEFPFTYLGLPIRENMKRVSA